MRKMKIIFEQQTDIRVVQEFHNLHLSIHLNVIKMGNLSKLNEYREGIESSSEYLSELVVCAENALN